jgi:hypothetical protein
MCIQKVKDLEDFGQVLGVCLVYLVYPRVVGVYFVAIVYELSNLEPPVRYWSVWLSGFSFSLGTDDAG